MAIFPNLEIESSVQLNDKTRFSASKSFVSKGSLSLANLNITVDGVTVDVYSATDPTVEFLDWEFSSWTIDIDATNNKIDFQEGGVDFVATLASATYTFAALLTEIKTKLELVGAGTYTLAKSDDDKITISADIGFNLLIEASTNKSVSILPTLGFKFDQTGKSTYKGERVEYLTKKVSLTAVDTTPVTPLTATKAKYIKLYSVEGDGLFSADADLTAHEPDILRWVPQGRATFNDVHRRSQELILSWLDQQGYVDVFGKKFTKAAIIDRDEVKQWSVFMTLRLIFEGISNDIDDVFDRKAKTYLGLEQVVRNRAVLRIDEDGDGKTNLSEGVEIQPALILRR